MEHKLKSFIPQMIFFFDQLNDLLCHLFASGYETVSKRARLGLEARNEFPKLLIKPGSLFCKGGCRFLSESIIADLFLLQGYRLH
jgi:hypothetical protein